MKNFRLNIFRRFAIFIFLLISVMGFLFIVLTYFATTLYHDASTQLLNKDVAAHIAKFTSPFTSQGINKQKADSVFQDAMVLSPSSEVYFLDTTGKVIYFHASDKEIKNWYIPLAPIRNYIDAKGEKYIKSLDPKDPDNKKIFSAVKVTDKTRDHGYIYVILASKKSATIMGLLFDTHVLNLVIKAFIIIICLSLILSLLYVRRISRNYNKMLLVLQDFELGNYQARFDENKRNEFQPITKSFNTMADLLSKTIQKISRSENERKNLIAAISHDLRTPLSIARGYAETMILTPEKSKDTSQQYGQLILNKIGQIEDMVNQLFELSKIEALEFKPSKEPFILSEITQELADSFQLAAKEKGIILECIPCTEHIWVNADISMMERVIQNLTSNALKNTDPNGSIRISVKSSHNDVIFSIENDGVPMIEELLEWINSGNKSNGTMKSPAQPGLGLVIVQKILRLHNSYLIAEFANKRNRFSFHLPVHKFENQ